MNLKNVREVGGTSAYSRKKSGNKYNFYSLVSGIFNYFSVFAYVTKA